MTNNNADWKTCQHEWSAHMTMREPHFNVAFGSKRVCKKCRAVEFEDWGETRASGGTPRVGPPDEVRQ